MKNFTFLFLLLLAAMMASGQETSNLHLKINNMQEIYSRFIKQSEHFSKANFPLTPGLQKISFLKNALAQQKIDSVIYQEYLEENEIWNNKWKDEYLYDSELNNTAFIEQDWNSTLNVWEETGKVELEFNNNGQAIRMDIYSTDGTSGEFFLETRSEAHYSDDGRLDSILHYFTEEEDMWEEEGRQIYHYNETGQLVQMDMTILDEYENEEYLQSMSFVYVYNDGGKMATSSMYFFDSEMEILYSETDFFYDDSERLIANEVSGINFASLMLERESRTDYEYNSAGDISVETYYIWDSGTEEWIEEQRYEYTYNNTSYSEVIFPSYLHFWGINEQSIAFNYTVTGIVTYSNLLGEWYKTDRSLFYYSEGTATSTRDFAEALVTVYPNPASDNITLRWDGSELLSLEIYNITGAKVIEKKVSSGIDISISDLINGIYLVKLINNNVTIYSGKLIKK